MAATTPDRLRFTLDTSSVIHAAQNQQHGSAMAKLIALGQDGVVSLYLTGAFELDQERASAHHLATNLRWLQAQPVVINRIPQPWRFDLSLLSDPGHGFLRDEKDAAVLAELESFMLPEGLRPGQFNPDGDRAKQLRFRRKVADVQHLMGHYMSGNDFFVTSDEDDMLNATKRVRILKASLIRIVNPVEALAIARQGRSATP